MCGYGQSGQMVLMVGSRSRSNEWIVGIMGELYVNACCDVVEEKEGTGIPYSLVDSRSKGTGRDEKPRKEKL